MTAAQRRFLRFIVKKGGTVSYNDIHRENRRLRARRKRSTCGACGAIRYSSYAPIDHHLAIDVLRDEGFIRFVGAFESGTDTPFWSITSAGRKALAKRRGGTR